MGILSAFRCEKMANELIQIINDAGQYYSQHEQGIKIAVVTAAVMALPAYYTAKKAWAMTKKAATGIMKKIDDADANITPEEREFYRRMNQHGYNMLNDRFGMW